MSAGHDPGDGLEAEVGGVGAAAADPAVSPKAVPGKCPRVNTANAGTALLTDVYSCWKCTAGHAE